MVIIIVIIGSVLQGLGAEMPGMEEDISGTPFIFILGAFTVALAIVGTLIGVLIVSAIHMLIAKIALLTISFKQLFSMNIYIAIITALGIHINGIVAAVIGRSEERRVGKEGRARRARCRERKQRKDRE